MHETADIQVQSCQSGHLCKTDFDASRQTAAGNRGDACTALRPCPLQMPGRPEPILQRRFCEPHLDLPYMVSSYRISASHFTSLATKARRSIQPGRLQSSSTICTLVLSQAYQLNPHAPFSQLQSWPFARLLCSLARNAFPPQYAGFTSLPTAPRSSIQPARLQS